MCIFKLFLKHTKHFFLAKHTGGHGVHSPYFFQFTQFVLNEKYPYYSFDKIERLRNSLLIDKRRLNIVDFGTKGNRTESVASIAKTSIKPKRQAQLLYRIANYIKAEHVLELGTSLGVSTAYLASASSQIQCVTMEGSPEIAEIAIKNFQTLGLNNIQVVVGDIDVTLENTLKEFSKLDLVFMDANHRSAAVLNYFESCLNSVSMFSVVVIDDIYWSDDMETAWKTIQEHPRVTTTIDLFHFGLVFFNTDVNKMHYKMRYW